MKKGKTHFSQVKCGQKKSIIFEKIESFACVEASNFKTEDAKVFLTKVMLKAYSHV